MRTQLRICTEADYLQAHLTVIEAESRNRGPAWRILEQRVASVLKKWILGATTNLTSSFNPPRKMSRRGKES